MATGARRTRSTSPRPGPLRRGLPLARQDRGLDEPPGVAAGVRDAHAHAGAKVDPRVARFHPDHLADVVDARLAEVQGSPHWGTPRHGAHHLNREPAASDVVREYHCFAKAHPHAATLSHSGTPFHCPSRRVSPVSVTDPRGAAYPSGA